MKSLILMALAFFLLTGVVAYADLHDTTNSADYMIVSTRDLIANNVWIQDLAAWRNAHGRTARAIAAEDIYTEFGSGTPSDTVLKEFFHYVRQHWQPPHLQDVFIVGFHDVVPSHMMRDTVAPDSQTYLSDMFYAADPDSALPIPVFNIGRLPWSPTLSTPLWDYYAKVWTYERAAADDWQNRVHLIADSSTWLFPWQDEAEAIAHSIRDGYAIERDYVDLPVGDPWHGDRSEIFNNLNSGSYLVAYAGLGTPDYWSYGLHLTESFFDSLTNEPRFPIILHVARNLGINGDFVVDDVSKSLLSNSHGGAIGYFGISNIAWLYSGFNFMLGLSSFATSDSVHVLGDIWRMAEQDYIHANAYAFDHQSPPRTTAFGNMLLGDPGVRLPPRPSAVGETPSPLPSAVELRGNYPNPFNSETIIVFRVRRNMHVALNVYDILGRQVTTLLDEATTAGEYRIRWNAAGVAAGVYFAVLQTPGEKQVRKMLLLK